MTIEVAVFAGRGSSIDLAVTNPVGMCPILSLDVTMVMVPAVSGLAGRGGGWRAEAGKDHKYEDMVRAGGTLGLVGRAPWMSSNGSRMRRSGRRPW